MNTNEAIAEIKRGLGFRPTAETTILAALQSVQRTFEKGATLPDWLLAYDVAIAITAATETFTLPTGFLRLHNDYQMYYLDSSTSPVTKVYLPPKQERAARDAYGSDTDVQKGKVMVVRGNSTGLIIPAPTTSFTAYLTYYKAADVLTVGTGTNAWLTNAPDYMVGMAGLEALGAVRDKDALAFFQQRAQRGQRSFLAGVVDAELAGQPLIMGSNR